MGAFELVRPSALCTPHVHSHARTSVLQLRCTLRALAHARARVRRYYTHASARRRPIRALTRTRCAWCVRPLLHTPFASAAANGVADRRKAAVGPSGARDGAQRTLQELARHTHTPACPALRRARICFTHLITRPHLCDALALSFCDVCRSYTKGFSQMGALYSGSECVVEKARPARVVPVCVFVCAACADAFRRSIRSSEPRTTAATAPQQAASQAVSWRAQVRLGPPRACALGAQSTDACVFVRRIAPSFCSGVAGRAGRLRHVRGVQRAHGQAAGPLSAVT
jgi:hypothetical protein